MGFLFLFGLFLKPNILPPHIDLDWFRNLLIESRKLINIGHAYTTTEQKLKMQHGLFPYIDGAKAIWFVVGCLFVPGMAIFIVYTVSLS